MFKQRYYLIVLIAAIVHSDQMPPDIPVCRPGDGICLGDTYTRLIDFSENYPQLGLPPSNPYQPHEIWRLQEHNPDLLQLLTFIGDGSNIRLQGIQNARVHEISGYDPSSRCNNIYATLSIPCLKLCCYFNAIVKLLSLIPFPASGDLTAVLKGVRIYVNAKLDTVVRNGERYARILNMNCKLDVTCDFHVDFDFDTPIPVTRDIANGIVNSNWRKLKRQLDPDLSKYTCQIIKSYLDPILSKIPIKDFFYKPNPF